MTKQRSGTLHTIPRSEDDLSLKDVQGSVIPVILADKQKAYVPTDSSVCLQEMRYHEDRERHLLPEALE